MKKQQTGTENNEKSSESAFSPEEKKAKVGEWGEEGKKRKLRERESYLLICFCFCSLFTQTIAAIKKSQEMLEKNKLLRKKTEEKRKEALKLTSDLRKRTQSLLEKQIGQQKALIQKLEIGNLDEKQKKDVMDTIKILQDSIEKIKQELVETTKTAKKMIPVKKTKEEVSFYFTETGSGKFHATVKK